MQSSSTLFVGLDAHKNSIDIAVAGAHGEIRHIGTVGGDLAALDQRCASCTPRPAGKALLVKPRFARINK